MVIVHITITPVILTLSKTQESDLIENSTNTVSGPIILMMKWVQILGEEDTDKTKGEITKGARVCQRE